MGCMQWAAGYQQKGSSRPSTKPCEQIATGRHNALLISHHSTLKISSLILLHADGHLHGLLHAVAPLQPLAPLVLGKHC